MPLQLMPVIDDLLAQVALALALQELPRSSNRSAASSTDNARAVSTIASKRATGSPVPGNTTKRLKPAIVVP